MTKEALAVGATFLVADIRKDLRPKTEESPDIAFVKKRLPGPASPEKNFKSDRGVRRRVLLLNGTIKVKARHAPSP